MSRPRMLEPAKQPDGSPGPIYLVSRAQAKAHLRVDFTDDDTLIDTLIQTAHERLDGWNGELGNALTTQTWRADYDKFPGNRRLDLPFGPVQSATIAYYDTDNAVQSYSAFSLHEDETNPFLWRDYDQDDWPGTYNRPDAVQVTFVAGYGDNASDVPEPIYHAMLLMIGHWYENREQTVIGQAVNEIPLGVMPLIENYRRRRF